ncbi:MAG: hypothetical protein H6832_02380 [Planctomycetes bacterium]|nr:hypothetical protein [Planctomycetota bacterium]MCB9917236.1 hypothetical protein [Planctomycetota bacterium]
MQTRARSILCFLVTATTAFAQSSAIVPSGIGTRAGASSDSVGFADTAARAQYLYGRAATGLQGGERITKIAMRMDEGLQTLARNDLDVDVRLSTRAVDTKRIPFARFDLNDGLTVGPWTRTRLALPPVTVTNVAQPFFDLPLAAPFVVDADATLCVDIKFRTTSQGPFPHRVDCEFDAGAPFRAENYGVGCPSTLTSGATGFWVNNTNALGAYTWVRGAVPGSVVVSWLDGQRSGRTVSIRYGNEPCTAYAMIFLLHPAPAIVSQGSGYARFQWLTPQLLADPKLAGLQFVAQHAMIDPSFQIGLSDGLDIVIGDGKAGPSFMMVYGSARDTAGFDPDKDDATSFWSGAPILEVRI